MKSSEKRLWYFNPEGTIMVRMEVTDGVCPWSIPLAHQHYSGSSLGRVFAATVIDDYFTNVESPDGVGGLERMSQDFYDHFVAGSKGGWSVSVDEIHRWLHPRVFPMLPDTDDSAQDSEGGASTALDDEQKAAVDFRGGNLLVLAGAGSGKTRALTMRALALAGEIGSSGLLVVTFTKRAALEIESRMSHQLADFGSAWIGTFHSICWRMLRENEGLAGLRSGWTVLDGLGAEQSMKSCLRWAKRSLGEPTSPARATDPRDVSALFSYARNALQPWCEVMGHGRFEELDNPTLVGAAIAAYQRRCRRSNRVDFDDLQTLVLELLEEHRELRAHYQNQFKAILVDEYQDTSRIQARILELLNTGSNVTAVGDDCQSIYGFRAARVENILGFGKDFGAHSLPLSTNYRSTPQIIHLANCSISNNVHQLPKQMVPRRANGSKPQWLSAERPSDEARAVADEIRRLHNDAGVPLSDMAVLCRAQRQWSSIQTALNARNLPYRLVGGEDFFSLPHVEAILDLLRLAVNPDDVAALCGLHENAGICTEEVFDAVEEAAENQEMPLLSALMLFGESMVTESGTAGEEAMQLASEMEELHNMAGSGASVHDIVLEVIRVLGPTLKTIAGSSWESEEEDLGFLLDASRTSLSLSDFLNVAAVSMSGKDAARDDDCLTVSTIHGAKGLEWRIVFVVGLVEYWFPLNLVLEQTGTAEEERRLFYVAATRAKDLLYLTSYRSSTNRYDTEFDQRVSRFVAELPSETYLAQEV